ncbi:cell division protein FtsA [Puteibacter caeruleilacunae]|nr:cell division protein FtsA [Puteibacter caeruleilacunae]
MGRKSEIIAAIDIGTSKTTAIIGCRNEQGNLDIIGHATVDSKGVKRGAILNLNESVDTIEKVMNKAMTDLEVNVSKVFVGMSCQQIHTEPSKSDMKFDEARFIDDEDVRSLLNGCKELSLKEDEEILKVIPQNFVVDTEEEITNPIGIMGRSVSVDCKLIIGSTLYKSIMDTAFSQAGWPIYKSFITPISTAKSILSDDEKEAGVVLVDLGSGSTSVSVYFEGVLKHVAIIPFGGEVVTSDIKEGCNILPRQAEALKKQYGAALAEFAPEDKVVTIPGIEGWEPKEISFKSLAWIIQSRMEEIIDSFFYQVEKLNILDRLGAGIVITGGGSEMMALKQLVKYKTGLDVRLGSPVLNNVDSKKVKELHKPEYSAVLGIFLSGLEYAKDQEVDIPVRKKVKKKKNNTSKVSKPKTESKFNAKGSKILEEMKQTFTLFFTDDNDSEITE